MASGKYVWMIGNDDLLLPETLACIKKLIEDNQNVEFFFINSYFLNSKFLKNFNSPFNITEIDYKKLNSISLSKKDKTCKFWEVIDPKVSWDFLIAIFLSIFNREKNG